MTGGEGERPSASKTSILGGFAEEAELLAEAVVDTVLESLLILDKALRVKLANRSFYRTFHVLPEHTRNQLIYDLGTGQWNVPELRRLLEDILPYNSHFNGFEVSYDFPDIGQKVMLLNARKLVRREGREEFILLAIDDITDRKETEQVVKRSHAELADFAHIVAHDLQTPLRSVKSYTELLAKRYSGQLDESADDFIAFIQSGVSSMEELIRSLLGYATSTGPQTTEKMLVPLQTVFDSAVANLSSMIESEDGEVSAAPLPTVMGHRTQLVQLFQNLGSNAIKYRKAEMPPRLHVGVEETPDSWLFSFRDNGIGIAPEHHGRIFLPLKRLHGPEIPGTGIGLATCSKIVEHHGGRIWVESKLGHGATFFFTLSK